MSVNVGAGALSLSQIGQFVIFNTHSYLAPRLGIILAMPFLSVQDIALYGMTFTFTFV
jgi:hypothetical protein